METSRARDPVAKREVYLYRHTHLGNALEAAIAERGATLPSFFVDALRESFNRSAVEIITSRAPPTTDAALKMDGEVQRYQHGDPTRWDFTLCKVKLTMPSGGLVELDGLRVTSVDVDLAGATASAAVAALKRNGGGGRWPKEFFGKAAKAKAGDGAAAPAASAKPKRKRRRSSEAI
tara:strand:- start:120 stop:650 length:531 start_codon:yes stop_codon:yes gene_type:complete